MASITDYHNGGLEPQEVAIMEFAEKITLHAYAITKADIERLRAFGLTDEEILDITMAASMRSFISNVENALGTEPNQVYLELEPNVRKSMQKGRPFAEESICPLCFGTHIIRKTRTADGREEYYCPACAKGGLLKPKNRYSEQQKLQILELHERYDSQGIQETFGISPATLARWERESQKKRSIERMITIHSPDR